VSAGRDGRTWWKKVRASGNGTPRLSARRRPRSWSGRCGAGGEGRRLARVEEKVGRGSKGREAGSVVDGWARRWSRMAACKESRSLVSAGVREGGESGVCGGGVASAVSAVGSVGAGDGGVEAAGSAGGSLGADGRGMAGAGSAAGSVAHKRRRRMREARERRLLGLRRRAMAAAPAT
jgi:hypothetical protein